MGQFRKDVAEVRRAKRANRRQLYAKWDEEGVWRPRRSARLIQWVGAALGIYLVVWGDTVERVIGVGLLAIPAFLIGAWVWVYWKGLQILRRERRTSS